MPWLYRWDSLALAREVRKANADYLVVARLFNADVAGKSGDPLAALAGVERYAQPVLRIDNAVAGGDDFTLLKVDPALLDAFLRTAAAQR